MPARLLEVLLLDFLSLLGAGIQRLVSRGRERRSQRSSWLLRIFTKASALAALMVAFLMAEIFYAGTSEIRINDCLEFKDC